MARPRASSWVKLKRLARYLLEHPAVVWSFEGVQNESGGFPTAIVLDTYSDSNWAGCLRTRRSTSGGVIAWSGSTLKSWSNTQATIALSSAEAEYYAAVRAAAEALGMQSLMRDLGFECTIRVWIDASAAKSVASRAGLGKIRHMETKFLWLQEAVSGKRIELRKILGIHNPADLLTKPLSVKEIGPKLAMVGGTLSSRRLFTNRVGALSHETSGETPLCCSPCGASGGLPTASAGEILKSHGKCLSHKICVPERFGGEDAGWNGTNGLVGFGGMTCGNLGWRTERAREDGDKRMRHGLPPLSVDSLLVNPRKQGVGSSTPRYDDLGSFRRCGESGADMSL